jgi:tetratricopeptide (TPR) repeat protein
MLRSLLTSIWRRMAGKAVASTPPAADDYGQALQPQLQAALVSILREPLVYPNTIDYALRQAVVRHRETRWTRSACVRFIICRACAAPGSRQVSEADYDMDLHNLLRSWRGWKNTSPAALEHAAASAESCHADELVRLGTSQRQRAQYEEALLSLTRAIELKHDCAEAHHNLGLVHFAQGQLEDSVDCLQLATHFAPNSTGAHLDLGAALARIGRYAQAQAACRRALAIEPQSATAWYCLGNIQKLHGELAHAVESYRAAIERDAAFSEAHCQLAFLLYKLGRYEESRASHAAALALKPDFAEVYHNLGLLRLETGYPEEALASFKRALELRPDTLETRTCIAHALRDLGRLDQALAHYDGVLAQQPHFGDALINRCYALLMRGDYAVGWKEYEHRFAATGTPSRGFPFPEWRGEPLAGKRILIYAEQGLGDEIMFASCVPDILKRAGHLVIECNTRLAPLYKRSFSQATIHGANKDEDHAWLQALPRVDFQIAIGSLPLYFRGARADFPGRRGYLVADAARVMHWRTRLAASGTKLHVGIAWRGGSLRTRQFTRSLTLPYWTPLLARPDVDFVSLQYGQAVDDLAQLRDVHGITVRNFGDEISDIGELAAAIVALDLVISVDNTVAHLAGALGRPVWILLPFAPEWRYLRSGDTMPWYPSARLFKQSRPREWETVLAETAAALPQVEGRNGV